MTKTFYSVKFAVIGGYGHSTMWFDNYEDAKQFADFDFRDLPVRHTYRNPKSIEEIERLIEMQNEPMF